MTSISVHHSVWGEKSIPGLKKKRVPRGGLVTSWFILPVLDVLLGLASCLWAAGCPQVWIHGIFQDSRFQPGILYSILGFQCWLVGEARSDSRIC